MSIQAPRKSSLSRRWSMLLTVCLVLAWGIQEYRKHQSHPKNAPSEHAKEVVGKSRPTSQSHAGVRSAYVPKAQPVDGRKQGLYEIFEGCELAEDHNNDGDSFLVKLPDGRREIFRLNYVDTPESKFKRYRGGETNYQRIAQQAADLGGVTPEQVVEIGDRAKKLTFSLLAKPFVIYTQWDSPFNDKRYHAFVEVSLPTGEKQWLHEYLISQGLARLITKPAPMPDGTSIESEKQKLRGLEREAKAKYLGVWSIKP